MVAPQKPLPRGVREVRNQQRPVARGKFRHSYLVAAESVRAWFAFHCPTLPILDISCPSQDAEIDNDQGYLRSF